MAALQSDPIARLMSTWACLSPSVMVLYSSLHRLTATSRNWEHLRNEMESESTTAMIPFLVVYMQDLVYQSREPDRIELDYSSSVINFAKYREMGRVLKKIMRGIEQSMKYSFNLTEDVWKHCLWISSLDETEIHRLSYACER